MVEQWQIDSRRAAGWSESEINVWVSSQRTQASQQAAGTVLPCDYSQYWLCPGYQGPEPPLSTKAVYSDAQYAYDRAQQSLAQHVEYQRQINAGVNEVAAVKYVLASNPTIQPTMQNMGLDLSGLNNVINQGISWLSKNALVVVIVVGAAIFLPNLARAVTGSRR